MANFLPIDLTGNEPMAVTLSKLQAMLVDLAPTSITIDSGTKTATATAGAATLNKNAGVITSESLTTASGAEWALTLTNSTIAAADQVYASVQNGTNTTAMPYITTIAPAAGSVVIKVRNGHASVALNGTVKVSYFVVKN